MSTSAHRRRLARPRGRWLAVAALVAAAAVVVAIIVSNNKPAKAGDSAGTTATGAATVQRRNLVATDTESGTLSYADSQTVYNRLRGTITWVPQVGQVIRPGHALFKVDNRPVLLMNGSTPAYRNLSSADIKGPDVYELNRNLVALGYNPEGIVVDDEWQAATTAGIERMQYDLGETETGKLPLGQVVFLPGPQMIQTVDATVGSAAADHTGGSLPPLFVDYPGDAATTGTTTTGTTSGTGTPGTTTAPANTPTTETTTNSGTGTVPETGTKPTTSTPSRTSTTPRTGTTIPKSGTTVPGGDNLSERTLQALMRLIAQQQRELQAEQRANHSSSNAGNHPTSSSGNHPTSSSGNHPSTNSGSHPTSHTGNSGNGGAASAVMTTSSTKLVVTVDLSASSQSEATIGEKVGVQMPDGSTVGGHVTAVSPVAQSSGSGGNGAGGSGANGNGSNGSGSSTVPVTVVLDRRARGGGLDQASVSVNFVQSKARHVLSVPVTALLATSGSSFAVQEADRPHRLLPVTTGLFAAGYVEIAGPGIHPGLQVTDSQG